MVLLPAALTIILTIMRTASHAMHGAPHDDSARKFRMQTPFRTVRTMA